MLRVPDSASLASMRFFSEQLGRRVGATTGSNMYAVMQLAKGMVESGHQGSVVTLICDHGERYARTYWDDDWMREEGFRIKPYQKQLEHFWKTLEWVES
jgi:cysteine synthase A